MIMIVNTIALILKSCLIMISVRKFEILLIVMKGNHKKCLRSFYNKILYHQKPLVNINDSYIRIEDENDENVDFFNRFH
jgi:hypothetical protein